MNTHLHRYTQFWIHLTKFGSRIRIQTIDFDQSYTRVFKRHAMVLVGVSIERLINIIIMQISPIFLIVYIEQSQIMPILYIISGIICIQLCGHVVRYYYAIMLNEILISLRYSIAHKILTIDPYNHALRSTGVSISKLEQMNESVLNLIQFYVNNGLMVIAQIIVIIIIFARAGWLALLVGFCSITAIWVFSLYFGILNSKTIAKDLITVRDDFFHVQTESLSQAGFIRSQFNSQFMLNKYKHNLMRWGVVSGVSWRSGSWTHNIVQIMFWVSVAFLSYILMNRLSPIETVTTMSIYIFNASSIQQIGIDVNTIARYITQFNDFWSFARTCGNQSYPVLQDDIHKNNNKGIADIVH